MGRPFVFFVLLSTLGCASFKNQYVNQAKIGPDPNEIAVTVSLYETMDTGEQEIQLIYKKNSEPEEKGKITYYYSGPLLRLIRNMSLYCDRDQLPMQKKDRSTTKNRRTIYEKISGTLNEESVRKLGDCKNISIYIGGENGSVAYDLDEQGLKLVRDFYDLIRSQ